MFRSLNEDKSSTVYPLPDILPTNQKSFTNETKASLEIEKFEEEYNDKLTPLLEKTLDQKQKTAAINKKIQEIGERKKLLNTKLCELEYEKQLLHTDLLLDYMKQVRLISFTNPLQAATTNSVRGLMNSLKPRFAKNKIYYEQQKKKFIDKLGELDRDLNTLVKLNQQIIFETTLEKISLSDVNKIVTNIAIQLCNNMEEINVLNKGTNYSKDIFSSFNKFSYEKINFFMNQFILLKNFFSPKDLYYVLVSMFIYLRRYNQYTGNLDWQNIHKLMVTSLTLSCKILSDDPLMEKNILKILNVSMKDFKECEYLFIKNINNDLYISRDTFVAYKNSLDKPHIEISYLTRMSIIYGSQLLTFFESMYHSLFLGAQKSLPEQKTDVPQPKN